MSYETNVILGIDDKWQSPLLLFFSTLFIYNLGFYRNVIFKDEAQRDHPAWMVKNKTYWIFSLLISLLFILYIYSIYSIDTKMFIAVLSFVSLLYISHKVVLFGVNLSIRNIPYLKTVIVSLIWAMMTVFPQVIELNEIVFSNEILLLLAWRFFFILPITLMFDIRDMRSDPERLKTVPKIIGINNSKFLAYGSLLLAFIIFISMGFSNKVYFSLVIVYVLMALSIYGSNEKRRELYYAGWFDALMALHALVLIANF